jgi:hypothetical protein
MSSHAAPSIAFVTGANAFMFGQLFLLLGSLARHCPGVPLHVCDFGFDTRQRDYLARTARLLELPRERPPRRHVWYDKASLGDFTERLDADCVVWLDADLIILDDLMARVQELLAQMQARDQIIAAAGSDASLLSAIDWLDRTPGFAQAMSGLDRRLPYLNSGFIVCRSREFLARWTARTNALPYEFLFEQNAFNLTAYEQPQRLRILDPWLWNICGPAFRSVEVVTTGRDLGLMGPSGKVRVLHATSTEKAKDLMRCDFHCRVDGIRFRPQVQIVSCFEALTKYQLDLVVECIRAELPALTASGLGGPGETLLGLPRGAT